MGRIGTALLLAPVMLFAPRFALAQSASPPTREEVDPGMNLRLPETARTSLRVDGGIERGPCPLADPAYGDVKVNFGHVTFASLDAVPAGTLDSSWSDMAGRDMPIAALCEVRDRAATQLRKLGFLAAVQVPPQRIEKGGDVRMDVLLARLVDVQVRGDPGHAGGLIAAHLRQLTAQKWFNIGEAERHLLLLRDLPGFDVRLTLRPAGGAPGEVVGDVLVERRPVEVYLSTQNLGSTATGREGGFLQVELNDVTGLGDRTVLSIYNTFQTREQTVLQVAHDFAIGADGLRLGGKFVYGKARPGIATGNFESETLIGGLSLTYPFVRREALTLGAAAGLELIDQTVDFVPTTLSPTTLSPTTLSRDKLRVLFARLDFDAIDPASIAGRGGYSVAEPHWRLGAGIELRKGTGLFGASSACVPIAVCSAPNVPISNFAAEPRGLLVRMDASFEYRFSRLLTLAAMPRAQYSGDQLLNYEQFSLGNYSIGRGLDPGIVQGDSGAGTSLELRYGKTRPATPEGLAFQPFAFVDAAWAWTNDGGVTQSPRKVWSAGGGVRARWGDHADANLTVAVPLEAGGAQSPGDVRVLFTVTTRLLPWKTR